MIEKTLSVMLLEDMRNDRELIQRQVLKKAPNAVFVVAQSKAEFFEKIEWKVPDIILADYKLPDFTGYEALQYAKKHLPFVPFIYVTGTLNNEEKAAKTIMDGASGFLLKKNLKDLGALIEQIMKEKEEALKREKQRLAIQKKYDILMLKVRALIKDAPNFETKSEIEKSLQQVHEYIQNAV